MKHWLVFVLFALTAPAWGDVKLRLSPLVVVQVDEIDRQRLAISELGRVIAPQALRAKMAEAFIHLDKTELSSGRLHKQDIQRRLDQWLKKEAPGETLLVEGPEWLVVSGFQQRIPADELVNRAEKALTAALTPRYVFVETQPVSETKDLPLTDPDAWELQIELPQGERVQARMCVRVKVMQHGQEIKTVPVWFAVRAYQEAWVLQQTAEAGAPLGDVSILREVVDVASLASAPITRGVDLKGKVFIVPVSAGQVLTRSMLQEEPWVKLGEQVQVNVSMGKVRIRATAEALENGRQGDLVKVRSLSSHEEFSGTVMAKGEIWVGEKPTRIGWARNPQKGVAQ